MTHITKLIVFKTNNRDNIATSQRKRHDDVTTRRPYDVTTDPSRLALVLDGLLGVADSPLHVVHRVLHVVLDPVDYLPLHRNHVRKTREAKTKRENWNISRFRIKPKPCANWSTLFFMLFFFRRLKSDIYFYANFSMPDFKCLENEVLQSTQGF